MSLVRNALLRENSSLVNSGSDRLPAYCDAKLGSVES
jgi:hypothetical protein